MEQDGRLLQVFGLMLAPLCIGSATAADAVDASAAEALMKKSGCLKCHAVDRRKDGPAFKDVATKYKGKADAEKTLAAFLTTSAKIKVDGKDEEHSNLKTKNDAEARNVTRWILTR